MHRLVFTSFTRFLFAFRISVAPIPFMHFLFFLFHFLQRRVGWSLYTRANVCARDACSAVNLWFCTTCAWLGINYRLHKSNIYSHVYTRSLYIFLFCCWYSCFVHSLRSLDFHRMCIYPMHDQVHEAMAAAAAHKTWTPQKTQHVDCYNLWWMHTNDNYSSSKNSGMRHKKNLGSKNRKSPTGAGWA